MRLRWRLLPSCQCTSVVRQAPVLVRYCACCTPGCESSWGAMASGCGLQGVFASGTGCAVSSSATTPQRNGGTGQRPPSRRHPAAAVAPHLRKLWDHAAPAPRGSYADPCSLARFRSSFMPGGRGGGDAGRSPLGGACAAALRRRRRCVVGCTMHTWRQCTRPVGGTG